nr:unnamed protein product [Callosobruchus chinensis]
MESPPSSSTWSDAFILSDDSGLLLTNGSASSGSGSCGSRNGGRRIPFEFQDSDCEEKSLSQDDSLDDTSDIMCGENFNTLKKGPHWTDFTTKHSSSPIEPPPEFQDRPQYPLVEYCEKLTSRIITQALLEFKDGELKRLRLLSHLHRPLHHLLGRPCFATEFIPFSPCHHIGRPSSRSSLGSSRLSSSHNSLSVPTAHRVDDSTFITQAVSHDTLSPHQISDLYTVPFDSDVYAVPVDVVKPRPTASVTKPKKLQPSVKKKQRRNTAGGGASKEAEQRCVADAEGVKKASCNADEECQCYQNGNKRHSVAGISTNIQGEPIHMTLQEVRQYLQALYSSSSDSSEPQDKIHKPKAKINKGMTNTSIRSKKKTFLINIKNKKVKDSCDTLRKQINTSPTKKEEKRKKSPAKSARLFSFKQTLCSMFRLRKCVPPDRINKKTYSNSTDNVLEDSHNNITSRALPPLPFRQESEEEKDIEQTLDFATSIQRVKDYGWYWGPISSEAAEKILSNEPDGSFIVRDSSDDHYIFSLTFKLNNCVRHVRIEHDQGNFSFGSCTKFKSQTIVEFIENAVEHSRSGRYLFFLHRRPVIGPVRVQLLHPVSRFKQVQSLQHMCRFVIHKNVRRDLIAHLPLPRRMIDYLNTPHYYTENFAADLSSADEDCPPSPPPELEVENRTSPVTAVVNNYVVVRNRGNTPQARQ